MSILSEPKVQGTLSLEEAIAKRRSVRRFSNYLLSEAELFQLLWSAQGVTDEERGLRSVPSAGATYPLEIYLISEKGVFHYDVDQHLLEEVKSGDFRNQLADAAFGQDCVRQASSTIVFSANFDRTTGHYENHGMMYVYMEAGHAAQNIHLQAVSLGLGSVPVGAFDNDEVEKIIDCPGNEEVIYLIPVGKPS